MQHGDKGKIAVFALLNALYPPANSLVSDFVNYDSLMYNRRTLYTSAVLFQEDDEASTEKLKDVLSDLCQTWPWAEVQKCLREYLTRSKEVFELAEDVQDLEGLAQTLASTSFRA